LAVNSVGPQQPTIMDDRETEFLGTMRGLAAIDQKLGFSK
jgi:hypothetical protein